MGLCQDQSTPLALQENNIVRPTANFRPSVWGDYFIYYSLSPSTLEPKAKEMEELKEQVKAMLMKSDDDQAETLRLIADLQRLGIAYHFEEEINKSLKDIQHDDEYTADNNLQTVTLRFRLLRQHGYNVSSDVFNKFKDEEGKFKEELTSDAKGLLCLYEASWLGTQEEVILDEAMDFAKKHMELVLKRSTDDMKHSIERALEMPYHRSMGRLEAIHYIRSFDHHEDKMLSSHVLLELARLDSNLLQSLHQAEIKAISMWWREMGLVEKLSFARDRVVECYFWSLGVHFEPRYSQGRLLLTKVIALTSVMDDMFDAYGTLDELQLFTNVIQRWDLDHVDQLPEYMRVYLDAFTSVTAEIEEKLIREGRVHHNHYLIESIKALVKAYFEEAKWASEGYMPTLEEYLNISVMSSGYPMLTCASLIVMGEEAADNVLALVLEVPKIVEAAALIGRIMNDLVSTELEQERKHVPSSVQCYMNDYGVTEQEACTKLDTMVANAWKDMNGECLQISSSNQKHLNLVALNLARISEVVYKHEDGYTNPAGEMKENISLLLLHPIHDF